MMQIEVSSGSTKNFLCAETEQFKKPVEEASTLLAESYCSGSIAKIERQELFSKTWQYLGPHDRTQSAPYIRSINIHGYPVVVTHDSSGIERCFHNVCRHRGGLLAGDKSLSQKKGTCSTSRFLRCGYHGWTYGLDGKLIGTPQCEGMKNFAKSDFGLFSIDISEWLGMDFIHLGHPKTKVSDLFQGIPANECPVDFNAMIFEESFSYHAKCNWKTYVDNYMEGYHVQMVHPELAKILDTRDYKTEVFDSWSLQHSPIRPSNTGYGLGSGVAHYYFLFPNMMLNVLPGRVQVNRIDPVGPSECKITFDFYYDSKMSASERTLAFKADFEFSDLVQKQDIAICETVQNQLENGIYSRGRYNPKEELGLYHFHKMYRDWLISQDLSALS